GQGRFHRRNCKRDRRVRLQVMDRLITPITYGLWPQAQLVDDARPVESVPLQTNCGVGVVEQRRTVLRPGLEQEKEEKTQHECDGLGDEVKLVGRSEAELRLKVVLIEDEPTTTEQRQ